MIANTKRLKEFEQSFQRVENLTLDQKLRILDGMYRIARRMGHFAPEDILEGIQEKTAIAAALHSLVRTTPR